jgi:sigma-E factor negative regulatory protein RseC
MIKETGKVIQKNETTIWVETAIKSTCKTCAAKSNCGTSAVAEAFAGKSMVNEVENILDAKLNDQVEIGIPEDTLLSGAFLIYMVPLLTALLANIVGQNWLTRFVDVNEPILILFTLSGGWMGFWFARIRLAAKEKQGLEPQLLKIMPSTDRTETIDIKEVI